MDKEVLRIAIMATGLIVVVAMLAWGYFKDRKYHVNFTLDEDDAELDPPVSISPTSTADDDEYIEPIGSPVFEQTESYYSNDEDDEEDDYQPAPQRMATPAIIQFCLKSKDSQGFNGSDLVRGFRIAGLKYGSLKIYERVDERNQLVDYGVACMVEPGTFPSTNLDEFFCPGIVFFMQPDALDDPAAVFDDYIETIRMLAIELDGNIFDHQRQPLTDDTVRAIRQSL